MLWGHEPTKTIIKITCTERCQKSESPCFKPKETAGEVPSPRLVHNIIAMSKRGNISSDTTSQHSRTSITHKIQSNITPSSISISSKNVQLIQGREIKELPKKLLKIDK